MESEDDQILDENGICRCPNCDRWNPDLERPIIRVNENKDWENVFKQLSVMIKARCAEHQDINEVVLFNVENCHCDEGAAIMFDYKFRNCPLEYTLLVKEDNLSYLGTHVVGRGDCGP